MKRCLQNFTRLKITRYLMTGMDTFQNPQQPIARRMKNRSFLQESYVSLGMKGHGKGALFGHLSALDRKLK